MASLWIQELTHLPHDDLGRPVPMSSLSGSAGQKVTISGTSAQSSALAGTTRYVRLYADSLCYLAMGANPTATASFQPLASGIPEFFAVVPGQKIAAITD